MTVAETEMRHLLTIFLLTLALPACKILPTETQQASIATDGAQSEAGAFNPGAMVAEMWDAKVLPYLDANAGPFREVVALGAKSADEAGAKYGFRQKEGSSPWTVVARIEGRIVAANTASRAATIDVDVDGDGKADAVVQIGPAMRGTALRDSLDFVNFNTFTNQIDFAQFGKAFNQHVDKTVLQALPRQNLVGRPVTVVGAFPLGKPGELPLVTPARITLGPST
jgi:predicted lipoprotein